MVATDFILAGNSSCLDQWPQSAHNAGILWCYNEQKSANQFSACDHSRGCGITDGIIVQKVFMICDANGVDASSYERLLLLTPAKQSLNADAARLRSLTLRLLATFGKGKVEAFEFAGATDKSRWNRLTFSNES